MRVGTRINREVAPGDIKDLARQADQAGLDEVWIVEDCFYTGGIATAATVLAVTETITVGIGVLPTVARNPAIAAMEIATLAGLYPGRLTVAFGHGVPAWMRQIGAYPKSPLAALEETLDVIKRLLSGERVSVEGKHVRLDEVELEHQPPVVPPLLAGVRGPKSLAVSGRKADGTILAEPAAPEYIRATREITGNAITTYNWFALDEDPARARERVRADVADALGVNSAPHVQPMPFGEELLAIMESGEDVASRLRPEWIDQLSVSGTLDACAERVRQLHEAGSESVILLPLTGESPAESIAAAGKVKARLG
ncbi:LLM class flavin-dependent oxidoreductase [Amycolatopsis sp. NPDC059657]|uniref:LLM class flavin-dependent oxidoreductase n=1 Tax=Amycolatopsis sp. NPDC059657 TaxID=3346899 RepID=UPI00366EA3D6